jgi:Carboxypeptidase regulatory-like domain
VRVFRSRGLHIAPVIEAIGALTLLSCSVASGQTFQGTLVGAVTDSSEGVVAGANVTVTNLGTGDVRKMATDPMGRYQFLALPPGNYGLAVEQSGFKRFVRESIVVEVNQAVRIDVPMVVGSTTDSVTVTAQTPLLQTETSSLGQVVAERNLNQLPLNGRNPLALAGLVPGVVPQGGAMQNSVGQNMASSGNYQIGGGQAGQSAELVDGAPLNISWYNNVAYTPAQDSVQEFKVETNSLSSEFGRLAGGVINFISKTGTNALHGTVYEFLRNKALNSNTFWASAATFPRRRRPVRRSHYSGEHLFNL